MKRKFTNVVVAFILLIGFGLVVAFGINIVGADTILPGYATAHLHLEVIVCEKSSAAIKAQFFPSAGRRYYFKQRTFEVSKGLNTIEWYIRKIPGGYYNFQISSAEGVVVPSSGTITLINDQVSDLDKLSLVICTPAPTLESSRVSDEPDLTISPTAQRSPVASAAASATSSAAAEQSIPSVPSLPSPSDSGDDIGDLPV